MALGKEGSQEPAQVPHWMRLLEEKYQRLHAKILNQAAKFTHRRASTITTRVLKESRKRQASSAQGANQNDLGNDQEENPSQFDGAGFNEPTHSSHNVDDVVSPAQVDRGHSYARKQSAFSHGPRPITQEGTRSRVFSDSTTTGLGDNSCTITPQTSGFVTRITSAAPRTRLSSACYDISLPSPRENSNVEDLLSNSQGRASQLDDDLRLQLKSQNEEWVVGLRDRLSKAAEPDSWAEEEDDEATSEKMNMQCQTERADIEAMTRRRRRHHVRPVKTSISRVSHKTSKSCPASFGQKGDNGPISNIGSTSASLANTEKQLPASVVPLTAKGVQEGRMRVFARMSLEARHAVDETLKEMKMEEDNFRDQLTYPPVNDVNGNVDRDENDNEMYNHDAADNASDTSLRNNVSAPTGADVIVDALNNTTSQRHIGRNYVTDDASSDVSIPSAGDPNDYAKREAKDLLNLTQSTQPQSNRYPRITSNNRVPPHTNGFFAHRNANIGRRLPQIDQGLPLCQDGFTTHLPLPSIKKANLAFRENTFEITPQGYDIRFREIITCQKGDRDTPPLDVRQQSIEKCQQWLVQYTPRR